MINAELISTGSELLSGRTLNSHAQTLGAKLAGIGIRLVRDTSLPDDVDAIRSTTEAALERTGIVFVSGGLGPTCDDLTRRAISEMLDRQIVRDADALENIRKVCLERNRELTEFRARQADVIEGAKVLVNPIGAAPGQRIDLDGGRVLFILPGPPPEFREVLNQHILPWLKENMAEAFAYIEDVYLLCGMAEADILQLFDSRSFPPESIDAAFCAAPGRLEVRLSSRSGDRALLEEAGNKLRDMVGDYLFADFRTTMEEVVGRLLAESESTLSVAESCTGGMLGSRITAVPGSSSYFKGGVISYSNQAKSSLAGVDPKTIATEGAVSPKVAEEMANGIRQRFATDYGIGITGIAGPSGGSKEKPVGLVYIGLADGDEVQTARHLFGKGRQRVRRAATQMALDMLRRRLQPKKSS